MNSFILLAIVYLGESSGRWYGIEDLLPNLIPEMKAEQLVILETLRAHPRASAEAVVNRVQQAGSQWPPWAITARLRAILAVTSVPAWLHYALNAQAGDRLEFSMVDNIVRNVPVTAERRDWGHIARMWYVLCVHPLKRSVEGSEQIMPCVPVQDHSRWILTAVRFRAFMDRLIAECTARPTIKYNPVQRLREFVVAQIIADPSSSVETIHRKFNEAHNDLVAAAFDIDDAVQRLRMLTSKPVWLHEAMLHFPIETDWRSHDVVESLSELCFNNRYFVTDLEYLLSLWSKYCLVPLREWTREFGMVPPGSAPAPPCYSMAGTSMALNQHQTVALLTSEIIFH